MTGTKTTPSFLSQLASVAIYRNTESNNGRVYDTEISDTRGYKLNRSLTRLAARTIEILPKGVGDYRVNGYLYLCIITLLPFFIEMLQYDWLWSGHMIIKEMFHIPMKLKSELARASMTTSDVNNQWRSYFQQQINLTQIKFTTTNSTILNFGVI